MFFTVFFNTCNSYSYELVKVPCQGNRIMKILYWNLKVKDHNQRNWFHKNKPILLYTVHVYTVHILFYIQSKLNFLVIVDKLWLRGGGNYFVTPSIEKARALTPVGGKRLCT